MHSAASILVGVGFASVLQGDTLFGQTQTSVQARTVSDSVQIFHAAWRVATDGHLGRRALVLWAPVPTDTGAVVRLSPQIHDSLAHLGVALEARREVGDDTVHIRITKWERDSIGDVLEFRSSWTTILRSGTRVCRTGSGNVERFRVRYLNGRWTAERVGPIIHGDRECVPIDST